MIEEQFIAAARKVAADISIKYALAFKGALLNKVSDMFAHSIVSVAQVNGLKIFDAYQVFMKTYDPGELGIEYIDYCICGFVRAIDEAEKAGIIADANDHPVDGFPFGHDLKHK